MEKLKVKYPVPESERHLYLPRKIAVPWQNGRGFSVGGLGDFFGAQEQFEKDGTIPEGFELVSIEREAKALKAFKKGSNKLNNLDNIVVELIKN